MCSGSPGIKKNQNGIIDENREVTVLYILENTVYSVVVCIRYNILEHTYKCAVLLSDTKAVCFVTVKLTS